jgi:pyrroloquinoline-quinone synthase
MNDLHTETALPAVPAGATESLRRFEQGHAFWSNDLFAACRAGVLTREDFAFVFGQYALYSKNFTRYLSGLMANLEDDLLRARLSENLWEEGGGADPEERHAELFRRFLAEGLGIDVGAIDYTAPTRRPVPPPLHP